MNTYKSNSAQNIVYIDHSTSGAGASISQSSADPVSLSNLMREVVVFVTPPHKLIDLVDDEKKDDEQKAGIK
jgi:hypothetical protein